MADYIHHNIALTQDSSHKQKLWVLQ